MMGSSMAPTAPTATKPVSAVTPFTVTPRPKLKRQPTTQKLQAVKRPRHRNCPGGSAFPGYRFPSRLAAAYRMVSVCPGCPLVAHSGLFEQARNRSAIGGEADIARNGSTSHALGDFEDTTKEG
jgi:hypothetical protein